MREVEAKVITEVQKEKERCRDARRNIFKKIEEKLQSVHTDVANEQRKVVERMDKQHEQVEQQVYALHNNIERERKIRFEACIIFLNFVREENNEKLIKQVSGQITKLQDTLKIERKVKILYGFE